MSPSVFHCHCLKVKSSTAYMYHGHQIIDPNHRSVESGSEQVIPANAVITASSGSLFWEDSSTSSNADLRFSCQSHRQHSRIFPYASSSDFLPRPCPRQKCEHLRSSLLPLSPKVFNNPHHLFPPLPRIHLLPT